MKVYYLTYVTGKEISKRSDIYSTPEKVLDGFFSRYKLTDDGKYEDTYDNGFGDHEIYSIEQTDINEFGESTTTRYIKKIFMRSITKDWNWATFYLTEEDVL